MAAIEKSEIHPSQMIALHSLEDTKKLAAAVAKLLHPVDCLTLTGTLGAGKTTFMQHLIAAMGCTQAVTSPTFVIVQDYAVQCQNAPATLYHMDAYRLQDSSECEEIGLGEMLETGILCVEWPEICADWLPNDRINLTLTLDNKTRMAVLEGPDRQAEIEKALASL